MKKDGLYHIKQLVLLVVITEVVLWTISFNIYFFIFDGSEEARLENPQYLWFLLTVPAFAVFWIYNTIYKNKAIQRYASIKQLESLSAPFSNLFRYLQYFFVRNALFLMVVALCNPQYGKGKLEAKREGIDLYIALDVSNSMLAEDLGDSRPRIKYAKLAIERLVSNLKGDRIGLVVFAGDAFVQIPLTNDYGAAKLFLSAVSTDMLTAQGTAIGRAIDKCVQSFDAGSKNNKAIIVISDGENHEDDALAAVQNAVNNNIRVFTVGVGSTTGSPIPVYVNGEKQGMKRDQEGNTVMTKMNEQMLVQLANAGGGAYVRATREHFGLDRLFAQINKIEKKSYDSLSYVDYEDQYFYFLWGAFCFLIVEFILGYLPVLKA